MAPPPLSDLLDWRVPYVPVLAMISVSLENDCDALLDGLRAPPLTGLFSPAASANGATQMASTMALAASQTLLPWILDMVLPVVGFLIPCNKARRPRSRCVRFYVKARLGRRRERAHPADGSRD